MRTDAECIVRDLAIDNLVVERAAMRRVINLVIRRGQCHGSICACDEDIRAAIAHLEAFRPDLGSDTEPCEHNEGYGCENPELHDPHLRSRRVLHNIVAHPLLVIWPSLGEWLHDRTLPIDPTEGKAMTVDPTRNYRTGGRVPT